MPTLTLEEYPVPRVVLRNRKPKAHLTDSMERTLCGLAGELAPVEGARPQDLELVDDVCRKCRQAMDGDARTRRLA